MEKRCKHKITRRCVIKEETEELGEKPLRRPPSDNRSTRQSVRIHWLAEDPPSLIYPLYLNPPSSYSYSNKTSRIRVLSNFPDPAICPIAYVKTWLLPILPSSTKSSFDTLKEWGKCLGYQPLNDMKIERYRSSGKSTSKCVEICGYNNL